MNGNATIYIGDQSVALKFGFHSARKFAVECAKEIQEYYLGDHITDYGVARLIQFGYENACLIKEIKPVIKFEEFFTWVEERMESQEIVDVLQIWADSRAMRKVKENAEQKAEEEKKSQIQMNMKSTSMESSASVTDNSESGPGT